MGGVLSFDTVTVTAADVVTLPAASRATAVRLCDPLLAVVVFHGDRIRRRGVFRTELGAVEAELHAHHADVVGGASPSPSTVPLTVAPLAGDVSATVGGVASLDTVTVTARGRSDVARRVARDGGQRYATRCSPSSCSTAAEYGAAVSSAPSAAPSRRNCTPTTPTLSAAVGASPSPFRSPSPPLAGDVRPTVGGVAVVRHRDRDRGGRRRVAGGVARDRGQRCATRCSPSSYSTAPNTAPRCLPHRASAPSRRNCTPTTPTLSAAVGGHRRPFRSPSRRWRAP